VGSQARALAALWWFRPGIPSSVEGFGASGCLAGGGCLLLCVSVWLSSIKPLLHPHACFPLSSTPYSIPAKRGVPRQTWRHTVGQGQGLRGQAEEG